MTDSSTRRSEPAFSSPNENDARSESHRDRDRIFYAAEFSRLEGVTQVATKVSSTVHNRLTHSYRVEQVARAIALMVNAAFPDSVDENVVMAAALAHDIGHSPFGHTGEQELHAQVTCVVHRESRASRDENGSYPSCPDCLLEDGFEGNAQSFRIISRLAAKALPGSQLSKPLQGLGLDLTRSVLAASSKYPWLRGDSPEGHKPGKWGAYDNDLAALKFALLESDAGKQTLAAQVMDRADDIAYAVHDLEDFFKSGAIPLASLNALSTELPRVFEYIEKEQEGIGSDPLQKITRAFLASVKESHPLPEGRPEQTPPLFDLDQALSDDPMSGDGALDDPTGLQFFQLSMLRYFPDEPYEDDIMGRVRLNRMRSSLISTFINALDFDSEGNLKYSDWRIEAFLEFLKQLTWYYVIDDPSLSAIRFGQREVISLCFAHLRSEAERVWLDKARNFRSPQLNEIRAVPARLSSYVDVGRTHSGTYSPRQIVVRAVVDYMCSLTDRGVYELAAQLRGSSAHATP